MPALASARRRAGIALAAAGLLLAACAGGPVIDSSHPSRNQDSRVLFVVLHYTVGDFADSLKTLTEGEVSAHYLIDDRPGHAIYRLVPEERRAWHAGPACWKDHCGLNASSVGIEIVNRGPVGGEGSGREAYAPYPAGQIDQVVALLRDVVERHQVRAERILGHNEVLPAWKEDPGPMFPWARLAAEGLIAWPRAAEIESARAALGGQLPPVAWFQDRLSEHGMQVPRHGQLDEATRRAIRMFQMRYRPEDHRGEPDLPTAALLGAVNSESYRARARETPAERRSRLAAERAR